jgi:hypothetical protein
MFDSIWKPAFRSKGYETDSFSGSADRLLVYDEKGPFGTVEFVNSDYTLKIQWSNICLIFPKFL